MRMANQHRLLALRWRGIDRALSAASVTPGATPAASSNAGCRAINSKATAAEGFAPPLPAARPRRPGMPLGAGSAMTTTTVPTCRGNVRQLATSSRDFQEEEEMIRDTVSKFAADVIGPRVRDMDTESTMDPAVVSGLFEHGLMGVEAPEEFGGSGLNFMSACIVVEEVAKVDPAVAVLVDIQNTLISNMLRFWGSRELQEKYFPKLCSGSVSSFCLSEVGSGSDAFSLSTKATLSPDGSYYTIEGEKLWISNAEQAELFFVFANVDPSKGYKGITCFIVEKGFGGITVGPKEDKLGIRASSTCPVTFSGCEVPATNVLGEVGQGYRYAIEILNEGRIGIGAQMAGLAEGCLSATVPYLFERKQFGGFVGDFQGMQHQVAQAATEVEAASALYRSAARMKEAGQPFVKEAAMSKLYTSQARARQGGRTASKCVEWLGGVGFTKAFLAEKFYRDCKIGAIYEGTSNIQLSTIAKILRKDYAP
ncbi:unnamed protein product [Ectocarpus fasciculatus]